MTPRNHKKSKGLRRTRRLTFAAAPDLHTGGCKSGGNTNLGRICDERHARSRRPERRANEHRGYGGSLKDSPPSELAAACVREAVARADIDLKEIGHVVFGNVIHTDAHDHYLARVAAIKGGLPVETPALTLNRLCGSGLQAIITAAQAIILGDADAAVAGGGDVGNPAGGAGGD